MSGHSKWKTIKHKKDATDSKRGQLFTKLAKVITIAAREGGADLDSNFRLRLAVEKGRAANMPKENIQRAIDRGAGKSGEGSTYKEMTYEGFGPEATAFMVDVATDNSNRSYAEIKTLFSKNGGNLGSVGSVGYLFDPSGYLYVKIPVTLQEEKILEYMEIDGVVDIKNGGEGIEIYTTPDKLSAIKDQIQGFEVTEAELIFKPKMFIEVTEPDKAQKLLEFMDKIEEHDDVQKVHANFDIPEEVIEKLSD